MKKKHELKTTCPPHPQPSTLREGRFLHGRTEWNRGHGKIYGGQSAHGNRQRSFLQGLTQPGGKGAHIVYVVLVLFAFRLAFICCLSTNENCFYNMKSVQSQSHRANRHKSHTSETTNNDVELHIGCICFFCCLAVSAVSALTGRCWQLHHIWARAASSHSNLHLRSALRQHACW